MCHLIFADFLQKAAYALQANDELYQDLMEEKHAWECDDKQLEIRQYEDNKRLLDEIVQQLNTSK